MIYSDKLLSRLQTNKILTTSIKALIIQSTGELGETANTFYDNLDAKPNKRMAHYVIDAGTETYKYVYSEISIFPDDEIYTDKAKKLLMENPEDVAGSHILVVEVCKALDYASIEKNLVKFCADFLTEYNLTTDNLWRRNDLIHSDTAINQSPQYSLTSDWSKFLEAVNSYIKATDKTNIPTSGSSFPVITPPFEYDSRVVAGLIGVPNEIVKEEDYDTEQVGNVQTKRDRFTNQTATVTIGSMYEPIYPDLTVPPVSSPRLYNAQVTNIKDFKAAVKPVLGKPVNNGDPYPIDEKITELELHHPMVRLKDLSLSQGSCTSPGCQLAGTMHENDTTIANSMIELSQRVEKRLVQLENISATMMRYLFRMSSRININCVYYGGQSVYGKYDCIRCMNDDLISDGQIVTMDQCLNCARYEPILGQVYDILNEELILDKAPILDDLQAARMTIEEYTQFTRMEEMVDENELASVDMTNITKLDPEEKIFAEESGVEDILRFDWSETDVENQKPDINEYVYKDNRDMGQTINVLKPENKYKDYYSDVKKKDIVAPVDNYGLASNGPDGFYSFGSYDFSGAAAIRKAIIDTGYTLVNGCTQGRAWYKFGAELKASDMKIPPADLLNKYAPKLLIDCSEFTEYCYNHNGIKLPDGATNQHRALTLIGEKNNYDKSIAEAMPGDLLFYYYDASRGDRPVGHVAMYVGNGKMIHAANSKKGIVETEAYRTGFYAAGRHPGLALPKFTPTAIGDGGSWDPVVHQLPMDLMTDGKKMEPRATATVNNMITHGYKDALVEVSKAYGIDPLLTLAIICTESNGDPNCGTGSYKGLMQAYKASLDPATNIRAGLDILMSKKKALKTNNWVFILAAYNCGEGIILGTKTKPGAWDSIPKESREGFLGGMFAPILRQNVKTHWPSYSDYEKYTYFPRVLYAYNFLKKKLADKGITL